MTRDTDQSENIKLPDPDPFLDSRSFVMGDRERTAMHEIDELNKGKEVLIIDTVFSGLIEMIQ